MMMPFQILALWVRGLLSVLLLALGPYLLYEWYERAHVTVVSPSTQQVEAPRVAARVFAPNWGFNEQTAMLVVGLAMLLWALPKGPALSVTRLLKRPGDDEPREMRTGEALRLNRPDGSELRVEIYGPADGQPIVLTHGWSLDSAEWHYARKELARYRLIVWDLPGLGLSTEPANHDFSINKLAHDLNAVVAVAGGKPVVLLGHSIGGMISLTHCKVFPEAMGRTVNGLILVNTTYTNPVHTTSMAGLKIALQKPIFEPLLHLTIALSPLARLLNWMSYLNGSTHRSAESAGFSGRETRGQLDFIAGYTPRDSPAVLARGMFGMLRYDATDTLRTISVPTLVITGDRDSICKPEASRRMQSEIPDAELVTLSPAKHQGLLEHHGKFAAAVAHFVERRVARAAAAIPAAQ